MQFSLIMPFFNKWELTHSRMMEFFTHIPPEDLFEILLINNGSTDDGIDGGVSFWQKHVNKHKIRYVKLSENMGFGKGMNLGASKAKGDALILYSNDVICSGNFIPELKKKIGDGTLVGGNIFDWDTGWNTVIYKGNKMIVPYCGGWFLSCYKKVWEVLGGFDEKYSPYDYEDVDLSTNAMSKGIELAALNSTFLHHIGGGTIGFNSDRVKITNRNREYWSIKWNWDEIYKKVSKV